jgi:hypothetical protein
MSDTCGSEVAVGDAMVRFPIVLGAAKRRLLTARGASPGYERAWN